MARLTIACAITLGCFVAAWNAWPTIIDWHQHWMAGRMAQRIAATSDDAVHVPIRQLAHLGTPALWSLVGAAASQRAAVADLARQIVEEEFANWQVQARVNEDFELAIPLRTLASALADHIQQFGPAGKQWAENLTLRILQLAETVPPEAAPTLLEDINQVLAVIPPRGPQLRNVAPETSPQASVLSQPSLPALELDVFAVPTEHSLKPSSELPPDVEPRARQVAENKTVLDIDLTPSPSPDRLQSSVFTDWPSPRQEVPHVATPNSSALSILQFADKQPLADGEAVDVPAPQEMIERRAELHKISSRELVQRLLGANLYESGSIQTVLRQRGFAEQEWELGKRLASSDVAVRLQLIDDLSTIPAASARRWLRWLLEDPHADVRFRALTAMATTSDPQLFNLARQLAIHDKDARVAELASQILRQARQ